MIRAMGDGTSTGRPRVLLLLPGGTYRAPDFVDAAARLGAEVVVGADFEQALAASMGERAVVVPLDDPDLSVTRIMELHRRAPIDAVVAVDDTGVLVAAGVAERLGQPHNPAEAIAVTRDKATMRERFRAAGIPQPRFVRFNRGDSIDDVEAQIGFPCVVKPISLSASRGVIRADDPASLAAALDRCRSIVRSAGQPDTEALLVESFVPGAEVALEGILTAGALQVLAIFDKPDPLEGPFFEETIYVTPSRLDAKRRRELAATTAAACAAIGLIEGPVHAELRVGTGAASSTVLEVAARTIGGLCGRTLRFGAGLSLEALVIEHALARPITAARTADASGAMMIPIPAAGILGAVRGVDDARAVTGIEGVEITIPRGRPVQPLPEGDRYLGFIFARAGTPAEVEAALRRAHACLEFEIT